MSGESPTWGNIIPLPCILLSLSPSYFISRIESNFYFNRLISRFWYNIICEFYSIWDYFKVVTLLKNWSLPAAPISSISPKIWISYSQRECLWTIFLSLSANFIECTYLLLLAVDGRFGSWGIVEAFYPTPPPKYLLPN